MRFSLRTLLLVVAFASAGLFVFDIAGVVVSDGSFPLHVRLLGTGEREIAEVGYELGSAKDAGNLKRLVNSPELEFERVDWRQGQVLTVAVPFSVHSSNLGRELSYSQFELLLLRITYEDGEIEHIPVKIPDGRASREITVRVGGGDRGK